MKPMALCMTGFAAIGLAGCTTMNGEAPAEAPVSASATADLSDASGRAMGQATATQETGGIRLKVEGVNLPSGSHGVHVHMTGSCTPPDFASAGGHWNPTGKQHGKDNPAGMHSGDLPNLLIGTDGRGSMEYLMPGAQLAGGQMPMLDDDGAAIVIHAGPDDYRTDPAGNSGGRIACGVFR